MNLFCIVALCLTGIAAISSAVALPFWLLGVPGVENSYATGWKIGLYTLVIYAAGWLSVLGFWRTLKKRLDPEHLSMLNLRIGISSLLLLAVASGVLFYAFKVMSRK